MYHRRKPIKLVGENSGLLLLCYLPDLGQVVNFKEIKKFDEKEELKRLTELILYSIGRFYLQCT